MKKIIIFLMLLSICFSFSACGGTKQPEQTSIEIPETENILKLQIYTIQASIDEFSAYRLDSLVYNLKKVKPVNKDERSDLKRGEDYIPITFFYTDGTKDTFFFFQNDGNWYVETDDGGMYKGADFITNFTHLPETVETTTAFEISPSFLRMRLELEKEFDSLGVDFAFTFYVKFYMENVDASETEAIQYSRNKLTDNMKLYQSAKHLDITVSDEELEKQLADYVSDISHADNFDKDYKKIYEDAGISLQESVEKNKDWIRFETMKSRLYAYIRKEFSDGKDKIGDHVYDNVKEYYYAYLEEIAYPQIEKSTMDDFAEQLNQAEKFYHERYAAS